VRTLKLERDDTSHNRLLVFVQLHNNIFTDTFMELMGRLPTQLSLYTIDITQDYGCTFNGNTFDLDHILLRHLGYSISNKSRGENPSFPTCSQFYKRHPRTQRLIRSK
jgi:hypothetical protein